MSQIFRDQCILQTGNLTRQKNNHSEVTPVNSEFLPPSEFDGEMADQVRAYDWSAGSLGPVENWPRALRSTVETMLASRFAMFLVWGPDRLFIYNDAYTPILGAKHPGALGAPFADLWSDAWAQLSPIFDDALSNRASYFENMPIRMARNGFEEEAYFTFSYSPLRGDDGVIKGVFCACAETTETVRLQRLQSQENEKLRLLFERAPGFTALLSGRDHVFEMHNAAYGKLIGGRVALGLPVAVALPETIEQGFIKILDEVFESKQPFIGREVLYISARETTGEHIEFYVDFIFQPMVDSKGECVGVFIQGHDVTEQALAKKALLNADRQKDQFIATLAHELRNPLAPISAAAHLLKTPGVLPATVERSADVIGRQITHMSRLLDDLLDVARIARNQMPLRREVSQVDALIGLAIEAARPMIDAKRHRLSLDLGGDPIQADADRVRIIQVISSLIVNAAKYTEPGGQIAIASRQIDDLWELSVADTGIGIRPEAIGRVFDMFAQDQIALHKSEGGLGIGLGLAKGIIELHGGSIKVHSDGQGKGALFMMTIPALAKARQAQRLGPELAPPPIAQSRSILVADDNEDLVEIVSQSLEALGHKVSTAPDGSAGLDAYRRELPSIAILDIGMPKLNGYELARAIRKEPAGSRVLLIAATGWGGENDKAEAMRAGFDAHLTKPYDISQLISLFEQTASK